MNLVTISKPLNEHYSTRELALALSKTKHPSFYIAPLRWSEYLRHKLGLCRTTAGNLNYVPYLRFSRKWERAETGSITRILKKYKLTHDDTFIITDDMEVCARLKGIPDVKARVVYRIRDRYSEYDCRTDTDKALFDQRENQIISLCDAVLCSSRKLTDEAKAFNPHSFWSPSAVPVAQIIRSIGSERSKTRKIGMVSNHLHRLDWQLLADTAELLEGVTVELIGHNDLPNIKFPKNVHIIGYVPFEDLSGYLAEWSAGLAVYDQSRFNEYCCPLKYFEYSAFNLPIISTTIPEAAALAAQYPEAFCLADDPAGIANCAEKFLQQDQPQDYTRLARENTWEIRAQEVCRILESLY